MNYIRHLSAVFEIIDSDNRFTPFHFSLYMSLFRCWNLNFFQNPVSISRSEMMKMAKIGSVNTYVRCLKELHAWNYIRYEPSYNRHKGSLVYLYTFDNSSDKADETAVRPSINKTNPANQTNLIGQSQNFNSKNSSMNNVKKKGFVESAAQEKNNNGGGRESSGKKQRTAADAGETDLPVPQGKTDFDEADQVSSVPPPFLHVRIYFEQKGIPEVEAEKFFNYFESNGWMVGGRTRMKDWKAAARNWILNIPKFASSSKPPYKEPVRRSHPGRYDEPL